jgi:glycosyl transferase family 4
VRVAILAGRSGGPATDLARALGAAGHTGAILSAGEAPDVPGFAAVRLRSLPDAPLRLRKIGDDLAVVPAALLALARGRFDAAHAFAPELACGAIVWARRAGRPTVFTPTEPPRREALAARRLRLASWARALDGSTVVAPDEPIRDGLRRWLAIDPPVAGLDDAAAYARFYRGEYRPGGG